MAKSIRSILNKRNKFAIKGSIWIECSNEGFFGPGPLELLERINETGSISQAAKQMKMSYKKAWEIINFLNTKSAHALVVTQTGGNSGGGSIITEEAKELIAWYRSLRERFRVFVEKESKNM